MEEDPEVSAMATISTALARLDGEAAKRVIEWAAKRYGARLVADPSETSDGSGSGGQLNGQTDKAVYSDFADLFHKAMPKTDVERALVAGYWLQKIQGQPSFAAQQVNGALKNLGHGVGNITDAFTTLQSRKPALVVQTSKSGRSRQARKTYKLTDAGIREVQAMVTGRTE